MATILDASGLAHFSSIFVFLFVVLVVYATLTWSKLLGNNQFINVLLGMVIGFFVLISPLATKVVGIIAPFAGVFSILILVMEISIRMLGIESYSTVKSVFYIIGVFITIITIVVAVRENANAPSDVQTDMSKTINLVFHPTFLGTVLILMVSVFTIALLTSKTL